MWIELPLGYCKLKNIFKPLPSDDPLKRKPSIHLAKEKLNWSPEIRLDEGLEKTIAYFESSLREDFSPKADSDYCTS